MKVCLLSSANSIHTSRWANGLAERGVDVHVVSAHSASQIFDARVKLHILPTSAPWGYVVGWPHVRKLLQMIEPDILNAHYATGYGFLSKKVAFRPTLLSVWGSDVYAFAEKSPIHRWFLRKNLHAADAIASTSFAMSRQVSKTFSHRNVFITPFGIDENKFKPVPTSRPSMGSVNLVIGTVKSLAKTYGIDILLQAYARVVAQIGDEVSTTLEITGSGPDQAKLIKMAQNLGIESKVTFHGAVAHDRVPEMLNRLDIYVALSRADSFGVAILEASACGKPVVVSDADGPKEVTLDGKTGIVVPRNDPETASAAIISLIKDHQLRTAMGEAGRAHVLAKYTWNMSLDTMIKSYRKTIDIVKSKNSPHLG